MTPADQGGADRSAPPTPQPASAAEVRRARRLLQRAGRDRLGLFLVEGRQAVREALSSGRATVLLVGADAAEQHAPFLAAEARGCPVRTIDRDLVGELSDTVTPQGILAVVRQVAATLDDVLRSESRLVVIAEQMRDPGNAGTLIRAADAAGADGVVLTVGSVDATNPKSVRASVGSVFHLPIHAGAGWAAVRDAARAAGLQLVAADVAGTVLLDSPECDRVLARPTAWVFGNEAHGLDAAILEQVDLVVRIPIYGAAESLNLATAAAVCLYSSARCQRRAAG